MIAFISITFIIIVTLTLVIIPFRYDHTYDDPSSSSAAAAAVFTHYQLTHHHHTSPLQMCVGVLVCVARACSFMYLFNRPCPSASDNTAPALWRRSPRWTARMYPLPSRPPRRRLLTTPNTPHNHKTHTNTDSDNNIIIA